MTQFSLMPPLLFLMLSLPSCLGMASVTRPARFISNKMCPFAQKAWIALEAADADYKLEHVSLYGAGGKPDWFWELNPQGTVPIVVCGSDTVLPDSDLILNEIAQVPGGENLVPTDEAAIKTVTAFRKTLGEFLPIGKKAVLGGDKSKMWKKLEELDSIVIGPYVCGDDVTVADCAGFPFLWRIENEYGSLDKHNCPNLANWLQTCKENPSFSKTVQNSWWWWW
jgi:glutathione S-transferase